MKRVLFIVFILNGCGGGFVDDRLMPPEFNWNKKNYTTNCGVEVQLSKSTEFFNKQYADFYQEKIIVALSGYNPNFTKEEICNSLTETRLVFEDSDLVHCGNKNARACTLSEWKVILIASLASNQTGQQGNLYLNFRTVFCHELSHIVFNTIDIGDATRQEEIFKQEFDYKVCSDSEEWPNFS